MVSEDERLAEEYAARLLLKGVPVWSDEVRAWVVKVTDQYVVCVIPMILNDRLTIEKREHWTTGYAAGWCYDKGIMATLMAIAWDPETQHSPVGWKKVACDARDPEDLPPKVTVDSTSEHS